MPIPIIAAGAIGAALARLALTTPVKVVARKLFGRMAPSKTIEAARHVYANPIARFASAIAATTASDRLLRASGIYDYIDAIARERGYKGTPRASTVVKTVQATAWGSLAMLARNEPRLWLVTSLIAGGASWALQEINRAEPGVSTQYQAIDNEPPVVDLGDAE